MNNKPSKSSAETQTPTKPPLSADNLGEGGYVDAQGKVHGDSAFHRIGWGTDEAEAARDLERMSDFSLNDHLDRARKAEAAGDLKGAISHYELLVLLHREQADLLPGWQTRLAELQALLKK